jgi:splicing factor 3B subunit 3
MTGLLNENGNRCFDQEVSCLDIGEVPEGR